MSEIIRESKINRVFTQPGAHSPVYVILSMVIHSYSTIMCWGGNMADVPSASRDYVIQEEKCVSVSVT